MSKVYVAGVGLTKVDEHWRESLEYLMAEASLKALDDAGISRVDSIYVGSMLSQVLQEQSHLGALLAEELGLSGIPAMGVEAASASGAAAVYAGAREIEASRANAVLVVGVDKMSDGMSEEVTSAMMIGERQEYTGFIGATFYSINALLYSLYMNRYSVGQEKIALFPVLCHEHAVNAPHAQYPFKIKLDTVLSSPYVAEPLRRFETTAIADGAAALVLVNEETARKLDSLKTELVIESATDYLTPLQREDPLWFPSVSLSTSKALSRSGIEKKDIKTIEIFDATSIMAVLSLESLGFAERGEGWRLLERGELTLSGSIPCNTFGGLKARGHPAGATGIYQIAELHLQLTHRAGKNQLDSIKAGLAQSLGGIASTAFTSILKEV
ncbi:MAG: thiolase domain-containing protein [Aigarchaeota archaeon]|nr:thiolase domain-containing protein [Aigarchaeota archaeon]MCX8192530.1 thiolase domain-containing protein [Nitrososphaeria archaeon]MDW7985734.1 beta-ketoacyl synthase N-terminal-like domain-containing protein [Nitrososphaerota archaeon]